MFCQVRSCVSGQETRRRTSSLEFRFVSLVTGCARKPSVDRNRVMQTGGKRITAIFISVSLCLLGLPPAFVIGIGRDPAFSGVLPRGTMGGVPATKNRPTPNELNPLCDPCSLPFFGTVGDFNAGPGHAEATRSESPPVAEVAQFHREAASSSLTSLASWALHRLAHLYRHPLDEQAPIFPIPLFP